MDPTKFTLKAQEAFQRAKEISQENQNQMIDSAHLLQAIMEVDSDFFELVFKKEQREIASLSKKIKELIKRLPKISQSGSSSNHLSHDLLKTIESAIAFTLELKDTFTSTHHLFYGILNNNDTCASLLKQENLVEAHVKKIICQMREKNGPTDSMDSNHMYNALEKFSKNLNLLAKKGKLDPIIGREDEIRRVIQILSRRTKNNPLLIGEPGVGKTAIAEGIAYRIINKDVPENLQNKQIFSLDLGAIIAGAKYKGEFEERLKALIKETIDSQGEVILFIDEIHTLVGAGATEGAMDAANILKPALARGELRLVGATTLNEYQKYFEKDKALERRFQSIYVNEPNRENAIAILRGIKERYETHHRVRIKDEAIIAAVELSSRYIPERFLPDKAIDLIDEAASKIRMEINSKPEELDNLDHKIRQKEIQIEAIKRENDEKKIEILKKELTELTHRYNELNSYWINEKELIERIQSYRENIEKYKSDAIEAERQGNYGRVAEIRYGKIQEEEKKLDDLINKLNQDPKGIKLIREEVGKEDIAEVVSKWTHVPIAKMLQGEKEKLLHLEDQLHQDIIGQQEAIEAVSHAIRRARAGLQDENRPIASFLFLGPTGVGKTQLAKTLAQFLFDDKNNIIRMDMSEFKESHSISRLIGSPPGYIGHDEGGQLTEAIRRRPYSIILLDEIEKAHRDIFNLLLQVLDEGRLTDGKGRMVNFKNTIIIMTSNMGAHIIEENFYNMQGDISLLERTKEQIIQLLKQNLRPEFLNRIDDIILFKPLERKEIHEIVKLQLKELALLLKKKNIQVDFTQETIEYLAQKGYDPSFGARPIKRLIQKEMLNELSKELLEGKINPENHIIVDYFKEKGIVFRKKK